MKKLIIAIILLFISSSVFGQDWYRDTEYEDYLYEEWDVEVEVWIIDWDDGTITINFEDVISENWFDVRYQLSTILFALHDDADWEGLEYEDLGIYLIIYSWFEYDDPFDSSVRYEDEDLRWDMYLDEEWMLRYFHSRRDRDRTTMVGNIVDSMVAQWEEANRSYLQRDVEPFSDLIEQQQQLEDSTQKR